MYAQDQACFVSDSIGIVTDTSAIRSPHLTQDRIRLAHHIGDAKRPADFNQLPARDNDLTTLSQSIEGQQHCRGIVVHYNCGSSLCGGGRLARACRIQQLAKKRSEEHTSELQSRFGISYAAFC